MEHKITVERLIEKIANEVGFSDGMVKVRQDIEKIKNDEMRQDEYFKNLKHLENIEKKCYDLSPKVSKFKSDLGILKTEFEKINKEQEIKKQFVLLINSVQSLNGTNLRKEILQDYSKTRDLNNQNISTISEFLQQNAGLPITIDKQDDIFVSVSEYVEKYGYDINSITSALFEQSNSTSLPGVDKEKLSKVDNMCNIIYENRKMELKDYKPDKLPGITNNVLSNGALTNVYHYIDQVKSLREKFKINEDEYTYIMSSIKEIVDTYQDIQLLLMIKETFENTCIVKYFEKMDEFINDMHNKIGKDYMKLNQYLNKLEKEHSLEKFTNISNQKQNSSSVIETDKTDLSSNNQSISLEESPKDEIAMLDYYRKQIMLIDADTNLTNKRNVLQSEYEKFRNLKMGQANISFYKYLKIYYPQEVDLIKAEEVKEQQIEYIYKLWKESPQNILFNRFAEMQGVHIDHPEDYVKKEDVINWEVSKANLNYVEVRKDSIEKARKKYQEKSFLWKVFNRKLNPEKLNFDNMTVEEINALYDKGRQR